MSGHPTASMTMNDPVQNTDPLVETMFASEAERAMFTAELRERAKGPFLSSAEVKRRLEAYFAQERRRIDVSSLETAKKNPGHRVR